MTEYNYWQEGSKQQWIFCAKDNSSLEGLSEKINTDDIMCSADNKLVNLGVRRKNGKVYSGSYVGICRLKDSNGRNIISEDGHEVILKVEPRFRVSVIEMINDLRDDDEFERYLAPQTYKINEKDREIEDLEDNELFRFSDDEAPVYLEDSIARTSSIITSSVFITMLKNLCSRPLMGKMVKKEENLVGRVRGKVVISRNIRDNVLRGREDRIYCKYYKYSEDILENQVLKAALHKAELFLVKYFGSASGEKNSFRDMFSYCQKALTHVSDIKISRHDLNRIKTTGLYAYYKPVLNAAKMVLNEITIEANGSSTCSSYVIPYAISMEKLFEVYVRAYLKKAGIQSYNSDSNEIRMLQYDYKISALKERDRRYSAYIQGNIKPDIILYDPESCKYIVFDVKYKDSGSRFAREDRLQILAYCLMLGCNNVGNIFPSQSGMDSIYYEPNEINANDATDRYYNQIELAIDFAGSFEVASKEKEMKIRLMEYLKKLLY